MLKGAGCSGVVIAPSVAPLGGIGASIENIQKGTIPEAIDCPNCGKPNEYSMGSCRACGTERTDELRFI